MKLGHEDMLPMRAFQPKGGRNNPFARSMTLEGGKGGSAPAADPNIGLAQRKMAELSEKMYQDFKADIWPTLKEQSQKQIDMSNKVAQQQFDLNEKNQAIADDYYARMKDKAYPLQDKLVSEAMNYNTEGNFQRQAALAMGDMSDQFNVARESNNRRMQSYGVDPTAGAYVGQNNAMGAMEAAAKAGAATKARTAAEQLGWAKSMDAAGLLAGLPSNQATSTGIALTAGNNALNSGNQAIGAVQGMGASYAQGYGGAMQGWGSLGQISNQKYATDVARYKAEQDNNPFNSVLGAASGAAMSWALGSDIRMKENIEYEGQLPNGLNVYSYEYKPEFKDKPYAGHGRFRGVMAHEVERVIPEAVVEIDGYKVVDYSKIH